MTIAIVVEGGIVQGVVTDNLRDIGKTIMVIDYDDDTEREAQEVVTENGGSRTLAVVTYLEVEESQIKVASLKSLK